MRKSRLLEGYGTAPASAHVEVGLEAAENEESLNKEKTSAKYSAVRDSHAPEMVLTYNVNEDSNPERSGNCRAIFRLPFGASVCVIVTLFNLTKS